MLVKYSRVFQASDQGIIVLAFVMNRREIFFRPLSSREKKSRLKQTKTLCYICDNYSG